MKLENDLLLRVARGEVSERPPIWMMRQAGRVLPQYRALRAKLSGFKELVSTPDLAAEVTIQPVDEFDVDAAIIFSDILVIPEAMGLDYELIEKKGPLFPKTIQSKQDIDQLRSGVDAAEHLSYVYDALKATKSGLNGRVPLIGFAGAPWTLFAYMIEGSGSKTFSQAKKFLYKEPILSHQLLEKITETTIEYLKLKVQSGADIIQVFDSWAGILTPDQYRTFALPYLERITKAITTVPVILFAKGAWFAMDEINAMPCDVVGLDWNHSAKECRAKYGSKRVFQGNLDPCYLYASKEEMLAGAEQMLKDFGPHHIANLGHGIYPDLPLENVKEFVNFVKSYRY